MILRLTASRRVVLEIGKQWQVPYLQQIFLEPKVEKVTRVSDNSLPFGITPKVAGIDYDSFLEIAVGGIADGILALGCYKTLAGQEIVRAQFDNIAGFYPFESFGGGNYLAVEVEFLRFAGGIIGHYIATRVLIEQQQIRLQPTAILPFPGGENNLGSGQVLSDALQTLMGNACFLGPFLVALNRALHYHCDIAEIDCHN